MEAYYNIHGLVKVKITSKFSEIIEGWDYFIRDFKVSENLGFFDIEVLDLDEFVLPDNSYNNSGIFFGFKNGIFNKEDSYAIEIKNNKMIVFVKENNFIVNSLIEYFLLEKGCTFIHGAGVSYKGKGVIFPAPPNVGKTILISKLRDRDNVKFLGDDFLILKEDGMMFSYPIDFSIYGYHFDFFPELKRSPDQIKIRRAMYEKILVNIVKNLPIKKSLKKVARIVGYNFLGGGEYLSIPAKRLISEEKIGVSSQLKYSIFLNKYNGKEFKIEKMELDDLVKEILGILQSEWYNALPAFHLLSTFGVIDFVKYLDNIRSIVYRSFNGVELYRVLFPVGMSNSDRMEQLQIFLDNKIFI
jgi:hypothetical protein